MKNPVWLQNKRTIKFILLFVIILILFIYPNINNSINSGIEKSFSTIKGSVKPDTNIVLITITGNDIDRIGPWPIKRSYYALLIKTLTDLKVKKIGLEVFLSTKFSSQAIYDNLLTREIVKSGRVILGSVAGQIRLKAGKYTTDSLSFPTPKLINEKITTGHLNFIDDNGIYIPLEITGFDRTEKAFSLQLSGLSTIQKKVIKVNFISSWRDFKNYSMTEFFNLLNKKSPELSKLKNKIVVIGITDPQIASVLNTNFDEDLPGLGLHAFALDNILNNRSLYFNYLNISKYIFIVILIIYLIFIKAETNRKIIFVYSVFFIFSLLISFISFGLFYTELSYSFLIVPIVVLFITDIVYNIIENEKQLKGVTSEKELLNNLLSKKENELTHLQKELDIGEKNGTNTLLEKIRTIKSEIDKLKEKEEDEKAAVIKHNNEIHNFFGMIYRSNVMTNIVDLIKKTAPEEASILILGESGTGKELAARAIHQLSKRRNENFVAVNCGALSETLLESELFGHIKGAFTGAVSDKIGRFEAANRGTIFLDEIAETSENFQVKLLRVLQTGDFEKVGSSKSFHTDVRIIAATNKNIESAVKEKNFREDLYYRLNVIKIELPPLRDRKEDIEIIGQHFLSKENKEFQFSKAAIDALNNYQWNGNIRELEGIIKRATIFAKSSGRKLVQIIDFPEEIIKNLKFNFEDLVLESLRNKEFSHSSINETAKELGNVNRNLISENFRGVSFRIYVESDFDFDKTVEIIAGSENDDIILRVRNKLKTFLKNVEKDTINLQSISSEEIRIKYNSKFKNLPQKFHFYLEEIIKNFVNNPMK
ncbi:MAG: sigma 54-interacting transcriptional regulator [Ignavibacteriaceae bacterium]